MVEIQDALRVPVFSSGEAGILADVSAATLGEESLVTARFYELVETFADVKEPVVVELEGEEARVVHDGITKALTDIKLVPPPDEATRVRHSTLRRLIFAADYKRLPVRAEFDIDEAAVA
jgi:hypothetical protein